MAEWRGDLGSYRKGLEKVLKVLEKKREALNDQSNKKASRRISVDAFGSVEEIQDAYGYGDITDKERARLIDQFEAEEALQLDRTTVTDAEIYTYNWIIKEVKNELEDCKEQLKEEQK